MSNREKPGDPAPYYEAHVFCCTNRRPAGHPRGSCADKGSEVLRDYMKGRAKERGLKNVRINSAAPTSSTSARPISLTTSALRA